MTDKEIMEKLADALEIGLEFLPDSTNRYEWAWDECTSDEQEMVKVARRKMNKAKEAYLEYIKGDKNG